MSARVEAAPLPAPETFLSGESGHVAGIRRRLLRSGADRALDVLERARRAGPALDRLSARYPPRTVLVLSVYRPGRELAVAAATELSGSRHDVSLAYGSTGAADPRLAAATVATGLAGGKFQNLNAILAAATPPATAPDWTIVIDDDVTLPVRFLDRFLALCERFDLSLAQPAQTLRSHAAWRVTRRRPASLLRETRFVEIGPVTAFRRDAAAELIPFPDLRFGWGLELHWAALATERGWRLGIADAAAVRHEQAAVGAGYSHAEAIDEARHFLAGRPYLPSQAAARTLVSHRRL